MPSHVIMIEKLLLHSYFGCPSCRDLFDFLPLNNKGEATLGAWVQQKQCEMRITNVFCPSMLSCCLIVPVPSRSLFAILSSWACILLDCIPCHHAMVDTPPVRSSTDTRDRSCAALNHMIPDDPNVPYNMVDVINKVLLSVWFVHMST